MPTDKYWLFSNHLSTVVKWLLYYMHQLFLNLKPSTLPTPCAEVFHRILTTNSPFLKQKRLTLKFWEEDGLPPRIM